MNVQIDQLTVQDIMSTKHLTLVEETPLEEIFGVFTRNRVQCVPVVDTEGRLQGSISISDLERSRQLVDLKEYIGIIVSGLEEDLRNRIAASFALDGPIDLRAREIMSVKMPRVLATDPIHLLCHRLLEYNCHFAMVVDTESFLVGTVGTVDVLKLFETPIISRQ